jgi:hypothetical protein
MTTTTEARERPILFSDAMVRAILDGRKVQTRRLVGPSLGIVDGHTGGERAWRGLDLADAWVDPGPSPAGNPGPYLKVPRDGGDTVHRIYAPWEPGDHLWVREAWRPVMEAWNSCVEYRAGGTPLDGPDRDLVASVSRLALRMPGLSDEGKARHSEAWHPSIHMPRWASRLTLRVTEVRVERLQSISEEDAAMEGLRDDLTIDVSRHAYRAQFAVLWDHINGDRASWAANPWVWVVGFERVTP